MKQKLKTTNPSGETKKPELIFLGNGPLADAALSVLEKNAEILFHAREKSDLETVKNLKLAHPEAFCILASFGVLIKSDLLDLFEPEGILNIHPSLLPAYRGASPIESAILAGDTSFSVSVMKLVRGMDAGPVYFQTTFENLPLDKQEIYKTLASAGAEWICANFSALNQLRSLASSKKSPETLKSLFPSYLTQDDSLATFTKKLDKSLAKLSPTKDSAEKTLRKIVAYQSFPKPRLPFRDQTLLILSASLAGPSDLANLSELAPNFFVSPRSRLFLRCADSNYLELTRVQPLSRKPMDAKSFLNGLKNSAR